jgi:hypothetical protein
VHFLKSQIPLLSTTTQTSSNLLPELSEKPTIFALQKVEFRNVSKSTNSLSENIFEYRQGCCVLFFFFRIIRINKKTTPSKLPSLSNPRDSQSLFKNNKQLKKE